MLHSRSSATNILHDHSSKMMRLMEQKISQIVSGITYSADCFAYCVMAHLLWPTRSEQYFLLKGPSSADLEELDEFNEAPHIVNNSYTSLSSMSSLDICRYDDPPKNKPSNA